jgi:hypothetical protein
MARAAQTVVNNREAHQPPRENYLNGGIRQVKKQVLARYLQYFFCFCCCFMRLGIPTSYIGGGYPHNQQNQHLGEAWKFAIMHETGKSQCIDN